MDEMAEAIMEAMTETVTKNVDEMTETVTDAVRSVRLKDIFVYFVAFFRAFVRL